MKTDYTRTNQRRGLPALWLAVVSLLVLAGLLRPPAAHAANITVIAGEVVINSNGVCSLREAIINANDDMPTYIDCTVGSGADVIILPGGFYSVAGSHLSYSGGTGLPQITSAISIEGNGATIDRSGAAVYRLFAVLSTGNLTLNNLSLTDGAMTSDVGGGAIYNAGSTVTLNGVTLSGNNGNNSQGGGAIRTAGGTVTINSSYASLNSADNSGGGGVIFITDGATVTINDSTFTNNSAANTGGGAISVGSGSNNVTLNRTTVGGGASPNTANSGAGIAIAGGTLTLNNSTITGNAAQSAGGGGIYNNGATVTLNTTTVTGNTTTNAGDGILSNSGTLNLNRSIVSGNTSSAGYDSGYEIVSYGTENANNYNVFGRDGINNNRAFAFSFTPGANDVNATDDGTNTPIGNILNTTLANNGGPTQTHALVAGSPVVDRAPSAACAAAPISGIDQRGYSRNVDGNASAGANECDSGSFEYLSSSPPTTGDIVIVKDATPADNTPFDFTENIPGANSGFTLTDPADNTETFDDVAPGSYTVTETDETGWTLDSIVCVDPDNGSSTAGATATIDLDAGETVTCTFNNSQLPPPAAGIYVSTVNGGVTSDALAYGPHDVLLYDGASWSKWFDGSAAGLEPVGRAIHNLNAVWIPDTAGDDAVFSFVQNARVVDGVPGKVNGMDLVWWDGGGFSLWFDGEDVGLTNFTKEKIDALHVLDGSLSPIGGGSCEAYLLISTQGDGQVPNYGGGILKFDGTDVLGFCLTNSGANTAGFWHRVLNGKTEGMPGQALTSLSASDDGQVLYLTTKGPFNVDTATGSHSMVYRYDMGTGQFSGPFFSAPANGLPSQVDGLHVDGDLP